MRSYIVKLDAAKDIKQAFGDMSNAIGDDALNALHDKKDLAEETYRKQLIRIKKVLNDSAMPVEDKLKYLENLKRTHETQYKHISSKHGLEPLSNYVIEEAEKAAKSISPKNGTPPKAAATEVIRQATKEAPAPNPPTPPNLNQNPVHNPPSGGGGGHVPSSGGSTHTPIIASGGGGGSYHAPNIKAKPTGYNKYLIGGGIAAGLGGAAYLYNKHRNQDKRR